MEYRIEYGFKFGGVVSITASSFLLEWGVRWREKKELRVWGVHNASFTYLNVNLVNQNQQSTEEYMDAT